MMYLPTRAAWYDVPQATSFTLEKSSARKPSTSRFAIRPSRVSWIALGVSWISLSMKWSKPPFSASSRFHVMRCGGRTTTRPSRSFTTARCGVRTTISLSIT